MWMDFEKNDGARLKEPALVVAVSTSLPQFKALYSQARELGEYMLKKMDFKKIATVRTSAFPPEVLVREEGVSTLPACHFYLNEGKRDLILFSGDASPMDEQRAFAQFLLEYAKELGVKELYSVGARWTENPLPPESEPESTGFSTDRVGVAKLKKHGIKVLGEEPAPFFASMVVAMAKDYGIRGFKLSVDHGEPSPHVRSVTKLLGALTALAGFDLSLDELKSQLKPSTPPRKVGDSGIYQ